MAIFYLLIGILYLAALFGLLSLWTKQQFLEQKINLKKKVSILVPFRNEQKNLPQIFESICSLSYRPVEVIFIDDHSQDSGGQILEFLIHESSNSRITISIIPNSGMGKKAAIETGVRVAGGEIIFTTDADCFLPKNWIEEKLGYFEDTKVKMVAGPVMTKDKNGFFYRFQQIEWASILLVTKGGFQLGSPIMCSAANMAYRKRAFFEVDGYNGNDHVLTGDDEFLLKKITKRYGRGAAVYQNHYHGLVLTQPQESWNGLFAQRSRWASKWRMHGNLSHLLTAVVPVLLQMVFLSSLILLFQGKLSLLLFFFLWLFKIGAERFVLGKVLSDFRIKHHFINYSLTSVIHPVFVIITVITTFFSTSKWKGRGPNHLND